MYGLNRWRKVILQSGELPSATDVKAFVMAAMKVVLVCVSWAFNVDLFSLIDVFDVWGGR